MLLSAVTGPESLLSERSFAVRLLGIFPSLGDQEKWTLEDKGGQKAPEPAGDPGVRGPGAPGSRAHTWSSEEVLSLCWP